MFKALKKLLNKNTQEYEEINNKILEMEKRMKNNIKNISIVIPVLNEEKNIGSLIDEIIITLNNKIEYEIIVVDDGSSDRTTQNIKEKIKKNASIKLIAHKNNYGQSYSLRTGITHSNI